MRSVIFVFALLATSAYAANVPPPPDVQPVPDGAPGLGTAPQITIRPGSHGRVQEYSANGHVYMLKITPKNGKPYYLIDRKGDGLFQRQDTLDGGLQPPMWKIKEF
jgi:hypothetical protein